MGFVEKVLELYALPVLFQTKFSESLRNGYKIIDLCSPRVTMRGGFWARFRIQLGSIHDEFDVDSGSIRNRFGLDLGSVWIPLQINLGSISGGLGIGSGSIRDGSMDDFG